jgi:hypothetical protein
MNMKLKTLAVAFAAMTVSVGANAGIVDLFDDGDQFYSDNTKGDGGLAGTTSQFPGAPVSYATILGGNRDLIVEKLSDGGIPNNPESQSRNRRRRWAVRFQHEYANDWARSNPVGRSERRDRRG